MNSRLAPVLSPDDLPLAELCAARLDGELCAVGGYFSPVDEPDGLGHRADILTAMAPSRLIAERHSAAWVWGARGGPPYRQQFCAAVGARISISAAAVHQLREVVIDEAEIAVVEGLRLTTPLRTAIDLARAVRAFGADERDVVASLMRLGRFGPADCLAAMNARRNLPGKHEAMARIHDAALFAAQPSLTR